MKFYQQPFLRRPKRAGDIARKMKFFTSFLMVIFFTFQHLLDSLGFNASPFGLLSDSWRNLLDGNSRPDESRLGQNLISGRSTYATSHRRRLASGKPISFQCRKKHSLLNLTSMNLSNDFQDESSDRAKESPLSEKLPQLQTGSDNTEDVDQFPWATLIKYLPTAIKVGKEIWG